VSNTDNVNILCKCLYVHTDWLWTDTNKRMTKDRPDLSSERVERAWLRWREPAATVNYRPVLSSERALQNNNPTTFYRKYQGERKIGCGSRMGADWLSVVMWLRVRRVVVIQAVEGIKTILKFNHRTDCGKILEVSCWRVCLSEWCQNLGVQVVLKTYTTSHNKLWSDHHRASYSMAGPGQLLVCSKWARLMEEWIERFKSWGKNSIFSVSFCIILSHVSD
jgi:hypothetical protein